MLAVVVAEINHLALVVLVAQVVVAQAEQMWLERLELQILVAAEVEVVCLEVIQAKLVVQAALVL
jgi:hypothetical protein